VDEDRITGRLIVVAAVAWLAVMACWLWVLA
jgi:hypothetical protein